MSTDTDFTSPDALADPRPSSAAGSRRGWWSGGDSTIMRVIAETFGVAAMLAPTCPPLAGFLTGFATTLGPVVFLPAGVADPKRRIGLVLHEVGHVQAFWHELLFMPRAYLQSGEKRATRGGRGAGRFGDAPALPWRAPPRPTASTPSSPTATPATRPT